MKRNWLLPVLVLAVLLDLVLTFWQNYQLPLDGDLAAIVLPSPYYAPVLRDPFGWAVLTQNAVYAAPNRFFAHASEYAYFRQVPLWLQRFLNPIASIYAAMALFHTVLQLLLLYVLGWYAAGTRSFRSQRLWLAMALMAPFFQTTGFQGQMGIVSISASYSFSYSLPALLLLVLLWPLYQAAMLGRPLHLRGPQLLLMLLLAVVLAFNGPIITGVVLVLLLGVGSTYYTRRAEAVSMRQAKPRWQPMLLWGWLGALCAYSLYIGRNNAENLTVVLPLWERYQRVPLGIAEELTSKLGLPLLVVGCLVNAQLIRRLLPPSVEGQRIRGVLRWLGLFSLTYIALLPLGGYRSYRPLILRADSILPITLGLVGFYGLSTTYLLAQLRGKARRWYPVGVGLVALVFVNADRKLHPRNDNAAERRALAHMAQAGWAPVVALPERCPVLSWEPITDPAASATQAKLLQYWRITPGLALYYYLPASAATPPPAL